MDRAVEERAVKTHRIALLRGDGIGEVLTAFWADALPVVAERCGFGVACAVLPYGKSAKDAGHASSVPEETLAGIRAADATLMTAVDAKGAGESPVGILRRVLDLYADVRPIRPTPGRWAFRDDIDLVCIRESTQGFLPDRNMYKGRGEYMPTEDVAISTRVITRAASERIARFTFEYARRHGRKKITVLHKDSIFAMTCGLFLAACRDVAKEYPDILLDADLIDNAANRLIAAPEKLDVLLTTNLFGDIISDEASALVSSLAPSANLGDCAALYMPVNHQPEYAALAEDRYDPMPAALCVPMLLAALGERAAAERVEAGIRVCLAAGGTAGGGAKTSRVLAALREELGK